MPKIVIYSKEHCPFCDNAKELFNSKNLSFTEYKVDLEQDKLQEMLSKSNGLRTVPQIFINNEHIGGFDDLKILQEQGKLEKMLAN